MLQKTDSVITDHCSRYSIILSLSLRNGELLLSRQYFLTASYIFLLCRKIFCITNGDYKGFCVIHRRFVTHDRKRRNNDNSLIITRFPKNRKGQPCDCPFNFLSGKRDCRSDRVRIRANKLIVCDICAFMPCFATGRLGGSKHRKAGVRLTNR